MSYVATRCVLGHSLKDVYKRQAMDLLGGEVCFSGPKEWVETDASYKDIEEAVQWADAVSYTHLDVYKRQRFMAVAYCISLICIIPALDITRKNC